MLARFNDSDRTFDLLDEIRNQMERVWSDFDGQRGFAPGATKASFFTNGPRVNVFDGGANLLVTADVPGFADKDLDVTLYDGVLTLSGKRKTETPEGYQVLRNERSAFEFKRSFALPIKVDAEKVTASVKDGVLTVTLAKAPEARPRQIAVKG